MFRRPNLKGNMKKRTGPKRSCVNCHFLQRRDRFENGQEFTSHWNENEIENRKLDKAGDWSQVPICSQGVWDGGIDTSLGSDDKRLKRTVEKNRKDTCFFIERDTLMNNDAAYRLWEKSSEHKEIKKSYKFALIALVITGTGTLGNFFLGILRIENHNWEILKGWVQFLLN